MGASVRSTTRVPELKKILKNLGKSQIKVGVFGDKDAELVKIARAHEYGVTIHPKNGKYLAIPAKIARGRRPREFTDLVFIPSKSGGLLVKQGKGSKGTRSEIYFYLVRSVTIPERSFIRSGFDKNINAITKKIEKMTPNVLSGKINPDVFLDMIGQEFAGLIQQELRGVASPPNAPVTKENKGSSNPLIDKGHLVGSIRHKVE